MPEAEPSPKIEDEDRISELCDDLLIQILLLVPTKDALTTTFLSKRWRFVWRKLPRLYYRETKKNGDVNRKSVWWFLDESMRFHNAPLLEKLFIELGWQCPVDVDVVKWVAEAVDRCVLRKLEFKLRWNSEPIRMPNSLYTCETLRVLILFDKILVDVPCPVYLPSLNQLELVYVVYKDEDSHVRLLSGCPVLKDLKVYRHDDVDDNVRNFTVKVPSLLSFTYMNTFYGEDDDIGDRSFVIDTPNLKELDIYDTLGHCCSIEYMPRLITASIDVKFHLVDKLLASLSSIKYLKLHPDSTMVPWYNVVYSLLIECCIYPFGTGWCGSSLGILLSNCPILRVLVVDSIFEFEMIQSENHDPVLWKQPSSVPKCLSSHLEIFEWKAYTGREYQKEITRYILENSKCLKRAEISLNSIRNLEEEQKKKKMIEELESMPRVSTSLLLT